MFEGIAAWCKSVAKPTLVIVDTLEKIKPTPPMHGKVAAYSLDYQALEGLQRLANENGITILVTTHVRKAEADDVFDTVTGTLGLTAAADTILVLGQLHGCPALCVRGRDVEEAEKAMRFDRSSCRWSILGAAADVARSDTRAKILTVLKTASEPLRPADIVAATELARDNVDQMLSRMSSEGEITKVARGLYIHPDRSDLIPEARQKRQMSDMAA
jgi:hypothetical protein